MTLEVDPVGVKCNLACTYCYEEDQRLAGNYAPGYDLDAMIAALDQEKVEFALFGGEALLMKFEDMERLFEYGFKRHGRNGVQTNGTLITERHIEVFKRYKVHVGISMDGPGILNDARWAGTLEKTREMTALSERAIDRLCEEKIPPSLIITLNRNNAVGDRLEVLKQWLKLLDSKGVWSVRLHIMEIDNSETRDKLKLTSAENTAAMLDLAKFEQSLPAMRFDFFKDMIDMLRGNDSKATCIWKGCDPYTTSAVQGIDGDGTKTNCSRTNKEGVGWRKASRYGHERQIALYNTPQEFGGCQGCRFFLMCKGECPGTGVGRDWRSRTDHCGTIMALYEFYEGRMLDLREVPLSRSPKLKEVETRVLNEWMAGIQHVTINPNGQSRSSGSNHHADVPHGDEHGDHTDHARK